MESSKKAVSIDLAVLSANVECKNNDDISPRNEGALRTALIPILKKFIYLLKKSTEAFRFKSLTEYGVSLINDQAYCFSDFSKKQTTKVIF